MVGDYYISGETGGNGIGLTTSQLLGGDGGSSYFGWGAKGPQGTASNGSVGNGYGSGGSGATGTSRGGGTGSPGCILIEWVQ
jgi:hypothetical protein